MPTLEEDLQAIEELHRRDERASREGDFETLRSLMDPEAVALPPGGPARSGVELQESFAEMRAQYAEIEILDYKLDFQEVVVQGDYAFEWGTIRGRSRPRGAAEVEESTYHVLRILRRREDGWKVYRTIWNAAG